HHFLLRGGPRGRVVLQVQPPAERPQPRRADAVRRHAGPAAGRRRRARLVGLPPAAVRQRLLPGSLPAGPRVSAEAGARPEPQLRRPRLAGRGAVCGAGPRSGGAGGGGAQRPAPDGDSQRRAPPERTEAAARVGAGRLGGARPDVFVSPVNRRGPDADRLAALRRPARRPGGSDVLPAAAVRVAVVTAGGARLGALGPRAADGA